MNTTAVLRPSFLSVICLQWIYGILVLSIDVKTPVSYPFAFTDAAGLIGMFYPPSVIVLISLRALRAFSNHGILFQRISEVSDACLNL